ncbi:hypothetical protein GGS23DRAFT_620611 [Durotheca rogersii]|uniref:uncharacterized protein n=1 Tax=Durotheca rogersii TaxID=419775 RepID=UPI00221E3C99|nr:uncharacterized protein GGS23DRAFT_620611 [Durotheca rogersii]KAI5863774.1 hypothetical protein GGS23DRAFT_620611 [Durotheca rogersii]
MDRPSASGDVPMEHILDLLTKCETFEDLPDDFDLQLDPPGERKVFLNQHAPRGPLSKIDAPVREYEEYLRSKWSCSEAMPTGFDPDRLEAARQAQLHPRRANEHDLERRSVVADPDVSGEAMYDPDSIDAGQPSWDYENEAADLDVDGATAAAPETIERASTPRIKRGSKPPLCRSAFAAAGRPSTKNRGDDQTPSTRLKSYPRAPQYFPFRSKARKS